MMSATWTKNNHMEIKPLLRNSTIIYFIPSQKGLLKAAYPLSQDIFLMLYYL